MQQLSLPIRTQRLSGRSFRSTCGVAVAAWISALILVGAGDQQVAVADITNWKTGETIPETEGIEPGPDLRLDGWNTFFRHLQFADFSGGLDLSGSWFSHSWLQNARFNDADATSALFNSSSLTSADFANAWIPRAGFSNTTSNGFTSQQLYSTASYKTGDLRGLNLSHNDLSGWDFAGQNLHRAVFSDTSLANADLRSADLRRGYFLRTTLDSSNLNGANLAAADLRNASLIGTNLSDANLWRVDFTEVSSMTDLRLAGAQLQAARLPGVTRAGFQAGMLYATRSWQEKSLQGIDLSRNGLSGWDFSDQYLGEASFSQSNLGDAAFDGAFVQGADFSSSRSFVGEQLFSTSSFAHKDLQRIALGGPLTGWNMQSQNLTGAHLPSIIGGNWSLANLARTRIDGTARNVVLRQANLSAAEFRRALLLRLDLRGANLSSAVFAPGTELFTSDLSGSFLWGTEFQNVRLLNTRFDDAHIRGANLSSTTLDGFTPAKLYSTASYRNRDLRGLVMNENDLPGWNFEGVDLRGASFDGSQLAKTRFDRARVERASFSDTSDKGFTPAQLYSTTSYRSKTLQGIDLSENDLSDWDFRGQNLSGADFTNSLLTNANFVDAWIPQAQFSHNLDRGRLTPKQLYSTASYFDCFRFVSCLCSGEQAGYVVSNDTSELVRFASGVARVRAGFESWYRIRTCDEGSTRCLRGFAER